MWRIALALVLAVAVDGEDEGALLQLSQTSERLAKAKEAAERDASALAGKSIYFLVIDRTAQLDYIAGMGFDCVWVTPVVKQYPHTTASGTGSMGYWAQDLYQIDPHFGTPDDYREFIEALHKRKMCIVQDFVSNHMGPIHNAVDVEPMNPFNKTEYFNQLFIGNMSFDEYTQAGNWPPPAQAMWSQSGAQCTKGRSCNCYKCVPDPNLLGLPLSYGPCQGKMVFDDESPCPKDTFSDFCKPGDYLCEGYNETITIRGWFYDLGDLNQTHPFVRKEQLKWVSWFVKEYNIDVLRLDTAAFQSFEYLGALQEAAGVPIIGEVTATNLTYHAQFQADPPPMGRPVLDGVLNFPIYFTAMAAFCHTWFPYSQGNLTFLGERIADQLAGPYKSLDTLGNFPDNHDVDRVTKLCEADYSRVTNAVAWTMFSRGAPIIYYGTEEFLTWSRESYWTYGYRTTSFMYSFLKFANALRKEMALALEEMEVVPTTDPRTLVFTRGADRRLWVYLNNIESSDSEVIYCGANPPAPEPGHVWADAQSPNKQLNGKFAGDCFIAMGSYPKFLVQRQA